MMRDIQLTMYEQEFDSATKDLATVQTPETSTGRNDDFFDKYIGRGGARFDFGLPRPTLTEASGRRRSSGTWASMKVYRKGSDIAVTFQEDLGTFHSVDVWSSFFGLTIFSFCSGGTLAYMIVKPPVGMGCPSGFYFLYTVIALAMFIIETSSKALAEREACSQGGHLDRRDVEDGQKSDRTSTRISRFKKSRDWILWLMETLNCLLILFILVARTTGAYDSCFCRFKRWIPAGTMKTFIFPITGVPTGATDLFLGLLFPALAIAVSLIWVIYAWCTQSHLNTEKFEKACKGLIRTRRFHRRVAWPVQLWSRIRAPISGRIGSKRS